MSASIGDVKSIFGKALELRGTADRAAFLAEACGDNLALRAEVESLLQAQLEAGSFLQARIPPPAATLEQRPLELPGTQIGPYRLVEQIGEGGMGTVFVAQQTEPIKRQVALKIIKPGMDSRQVIARFEAERQALALMDHSNIAKVLDAGTTDAGRPYFVMELVKGLPITRYCDEHHLTPKERLELFVPICQAIQHAHHKGIIHRDLKPTNILVALYDDQPVPKVIDFGVAKATGQQLTEQTLHTGFGAVVGTVEYMSPEQAGFNQLDVDSRSDIYSLGVLLYELLAGSPPFTRQELEQAGVLEMLRVIREQEPSRPSTKLSSSDALPTLSANRGTEPAKLTKLLRGELDWIVMKALEKDRSRRYETASGLAQDLQRYLADEPILACPPSTAYRIKKFIRRNRGPALAALLVVLALITGTCIATWQAIRARQAENKALTERNAKDAALRAEQRAREEASKAAAQTLEVLRAMTDASMSRQIGTQVELTDDDRAYFMQVLKQYERLAAIKGDSQESRALRAEGYYRVGVMHNRLSQWRRALPAYEQARDLYQQLAAEFPADPGYRHWLAESQHRMGQVLVELGQRSEAGREFRQSFAEYQQLHAGFPDSPEYWDGIGEVRGDLAGSLSAQGKWLEAEAEFRKALLADEQLATAFPKEPKYQEGAARLHGRLGLLLEEHTRLADAEPEYRKALAIHQQLADDFPNLPGYQRDLASCHRQLGSLHRLQGNLPKSLEEFRAALAIEHKIAAKYPAVPQYRNNLAKTYGMLGNLLLDLGKPADADAEFRRAIALQQRLVDDFRDVPSYRGGLALYYSRLGIALEQQGPLDQAIAAHRRAVELQPPFYSAYDTLVDSLTKAGRLDATAVECEAQLCLEPEHVLSHYLLARVRARQRRWEDAIDHFSHVLALNASFPEVHLKRGRVYAALSRWEQAIGDFSKEIELTPTRPYAYNELAWLLATSPDEKYRDPPRAVTAARRAVELEPARGTFWRTLGVARYRAGDWKAATEGLEKAVQLRMGGDGLAGFFLAMAQWQLGDKDQARKRFDEAVLWMEQHAPQDEELRRFRTEAEELLGIRSGHEGDM